jgi:hypothetical protein
MSTVQNHPEFIPSRSEIAEACAEVRKEWTRRDEGRHWRRSRRPSRPLPGTLFYVAPPLPPCPAVIGLPEPAPETHLLRVFEPLPGNWGWERRFRARKNSRWHGLRILRAWLDEISRDNGDLRMA